MSQSQGRTAKSPKSRPFTHSMRIGSLLGIDIHLDASVLIIFALVVWILGGNVFPSWHPDWSARLSWITGLGAGLLFFVSLLLHEMAHSLMARHYGIRVPRITLFLFGGVSEMESEPTTPKTEFLIAIVGPAMSLLLGLIFSTLAGILAPAEFADLLIRDQAGALQSLAPLTTLLFWLGPVNFILGVFNLVPGFPLDGGRVLRATVWWLTGSLERATRTAAGAGRLFGWLLMALGVMQVLSGAAVQGLWLVLIGWFLSSAASSSYSQMMMRRTLQGCRVEDVMRTHFETVDADIPVARFIDDFLLKSNQRLWPVTAAGRLVGFANLETIQELEAERRHTLRIRDIMRTDLDELSLPPHADAMKAMERLSLSGSPLAVVRGEEVLGLVAQDDMVKWLALHRR